MLSAWSLEVLSGVVILAALYYVSWSYLARWTCGLLLSGSVIFSPIDAKLTKIEQNGIANGTITEHSAQNGEVKERENHSDTARESVQHYGGTPRLVTRGVLAEISQLIVGQIVSVSAVVSGAIVMYQTRDDVMHSRSLFLVPFVHTVVWYFVFDLAAMFWSFSLQREGLRKLKWTRWLQLFFKKKWTFLFHHAIILTVAYPLIVNYQVRRSLGDFFVGMLIVEDLSTPFLSAAKILRLLGLKKTILYRVNGGILLTTFLLVRVLYSPLAVLIYAGQYHNWNVWSALKAMYPVCHFFNALQLILQTYWYSALVSIALGTTRTKGKSKTALVQSSSRTSTDVKCD